MPGCSRFPHALGKLEIASVPPRVRRGPERRRVPQADPESRPAIPDRRGREGHPTGRAELQDQRRGRVRPRGSGAPQGEARRTGGRPHRRPEADRADVARSAGEGGRRSGPRPDGGCRVRRRDGRTDPRRRDPDVAARPRADRRTVGRPGELGDGRSDRRAPRDAPRERRHRRRGEGRRSRGLDGARRRAAAGLHRPPPGPLDDPIRREHAALRASARNHEGRAPADPGDRARASRPAVHVRGPGPVAARREGPRGDGDGIDRRAGEEARRAPAGRALSAQSGGAARVAVFGRGVRALADALAKLGVEVLLAEDSALAEYTGDGYVQAVRALLESTKPPVLLVAHTPQGYDLAPAVAGALDLPLVTNAVGLRLDGNRLVVTRRLLN